MDFSKINLKDNQKLARLIVLEAIDKKFKNRRDFEVFRNSIVKKNKGKIFHNLYFIRAYNDLIKECRIKPNSAFLSLIQKRSVRTQSGVAPVTVLTKPYPCPGNCIYCPTDVRMPKSYLPSQPAAQRAFRQQFNPYTQVFVRLKALQMTGHEISKVELRIIGGTWSYYPKKYQTEFVKECLLAMNEFHKQLENKKYDKMQNFVKDQAITSAYGVDNISTVMIKPLDKKNITLAKALKDNEKAKVRCIGINIETRPDFIDQAEVKRLRVFGITKVEMGVQTTFDSVHKFTCRGHGVAEVKKATKLLKDAGFKIGYHMMPGLPSSTPEMDKKMVAELFENSDYQPDYLKIYPCVVMQKAKLSLMYRKGLYKPYDDKTLEDVLFEEMKSIPEWCRVDRVARDIPADDIEGGFRISNIRQVLDQRFKKEGISQREIRSREIKADLVDPEKTVLVVREYIASKGKEMFLSYEDLKKDKLVGLLRLRFPEKTFISEIKNAALVREIHVYGQQVAVGEKIKSEKQHLGYGTKLMIEAEKMAKTAGYKKVAVIAGIGTREYYRKRGYKLIGTYMLKTL